MSDVAISTCCNICSEKFMESTFLWPLGSYHASSRPLTSRLECWLFITVQCCLTTTSFSSWNLTTTSFLSWKWSHFHCYIMPSVCCPACCINIIVFCKWWFNYCLIELMMASQLIKMTKYKGRINSVNQKCHNLQKSFCTNWVFTNLRTKHSTIYGAVNKRALILKQSL